MSIMWMSLNPDKARFFRISHPNPPAPLRMVNFQFGVIKLTYITLYMISINHKQLSR